jgi:glycosyltransferase involved in cell wall biosynthesis
MAKIVFSVVVTVLNEADSITPLLTTLINQSDKPGEIIVIDAGSSDGTVSMIKKIAAKSSVPVHCYFCKGFNRSQARNEGVRSANYQHIAVTDAGCEVDENWLRELGSLFNDSVEAVGGYYLPKIDRPIQYVFSRFTCVEPMDFNHENFLPSSRSIAFSKNIWNQVGGYPEYLETCEDLIFARKLADTGKLKVTDKALVYWRQADGIRVYFKQIAGYARGDVEAGYGAHIRRIILVWLRYVAFILLPPLFGVYLLFVWFKFRISPIHFEDAIITFMVQVITDWAVMTGSLNGLMRRWRR